VIQIGRDNAGDRSVTSGDVVRRVGDGLGCHGYDRPAGPLVNYGPHSYSKFTFMIMFDHKQWIT